MKAWVLLVPDAPPITAMVVLFADVWRNVTGTLYRGPSIILTMRLVSLISTLQKGSVPLHTNLLADGFAGGTTTFGGGTVSGRVVTGLVGVVAV